MAPICYVAVRRWKSGQINIFAVNNMAHLCIPPYTYCLKLYFDQYLFQMQLTNRTNVTEKLSQVRKQSRQSNLKTTAMLTVFFDYRGVVSCEFFPPGQTID